MRDFPKSSGASFLSLRDATTDLSNMLKAFIGTNFLFVSYAFSKSGVWRGILGLVLIAVITEHGCLMLIKVKNNIRLSSVSKGDLTYGEIAGIVAGRKAETIVNIAILITQFGACVNYLIFMSRTMRDLLQSDAALETFIFVPVPFLIALAMLRSVRSLGRASAVANVALFGGVFCMITVILQVFKWKPTHPPISQFPIFFGIMASALEGIGLVIPIQSSMKNPSNFPIILRVALFLPMAVLMLVGVLGSATYGNGTDVIILFNITSGESKSFAIHIIKAILGIGIFFTYPLQVVPVFHFAESVVRSRHPILAISESHKSRDFYEETSRGTSGGIRKEGAIRVELSSQPGTFTKEEGSLFLKDRRLALIRSSVVMLTALCAVFAGPYFGLFMALVGSLGASCLAFCAPALLHYLAFRHELSMGACVKDCAIMVFGLVGGVMGTWTSVSGIVQQGR